MNTKSTCRKDLLLCLTNIKSGNKGVQSERVEREATQEDRSGSLGIFQSVCMISFRGIWPNVDQHLPHATAGLFDMAPTVRQKTPAKRKASSIPGNVEKKPSSAKKRQAKAVRSTKSFEDGLSSSKRYSSETNRVQAIQQTLNQLIIRTKESSTICPSQIPRLLNKEDSKTYPDWRGMMDEVRGVVWEEVRKGRVEVTQGGGVRTYDERGEIKGPIRVRRGADWVD